MGHRKMVIGISAAALVLGGGSIAAGAPTTATEAGASAAGAARSCSPLTTTPRYRGDIPTAKQVLGFDLGTRKATDQQLYRYLSAIDRASDQVVTGTFARTAKGTPLKYALMSTKGNVKPAKLKQISADAASLRDPSLSAAERQLIEQRMPVILWLSGNVHGNEAAAGDAIMQIMYELSDRSDCVATNITSNALVGFIPTQNPDGRTADTRENSYAFDMNRDWFARTQPETSGKLDLLNTYPPQLYIDEHGMGGNGYFFPPNSDPTYHETSAQSINWINNVYGAANGAAFTAKMLSFETYQAGYDLFYQGYGDTTPTTQFGAAGMTFEVGQQASYPEQTYKHYLSAMSSLYAGATNRQSILTQWHQGYAQAQRQGQQCSLQPNKVYNPGNTVEYTVPDKAVCGYFLRTDDAQKQRDLSTVVRRLQQAGVSVYTLTKPLAVPDYTAYGRPAAAQTMPTGTYWIPMAQAEKHWIQAMLNENTYVPFPYFYDVSGWSMPLLSNLDGGYTGTKVKPTMQKLPLQTVRPVKLPAGLPRVGVLSSSSSPFRPSQSAGWLNWRLDKDWKIPQTAVDPSQVSASTLSRLDTLIVPDTNADRMATLLGDSGQAALRAWVNGGGHLIGWEGGAQLAASIGLSSAILSNPQGQAPGTLFRVKVAANSPLTTGVGSTDWAMYNSDPVMRAANPADVVASYPAANSADWYVSGYQVGAEELGETAMEISEPVGTGNVTVFSVDPNFRAYSDGTAKLLYNAILTSRGTQTARSLATPAPRAGSADRRVAETRAQQAAARLVRPEDPALEVRVRPTDAPTAERVLRAHGVATQTVTSANSVSLTVAPGRNASPDPAPWVRGLAEELSQAGVRPLDISTP